MTGLDRGWVPAGAVTLARYASVPAGEYRFEVQTSLGGGAWSRASVLPITLQPRFYETWFAAFGLLAALVIVYGGHRHSSAEFSHGACPDGLSRLNDEPSSPASSARPPSRSA